MDVRKIKERYKNYGKENRFIISHPSVVFIYYISILLCCFIFTNPLFTVTIFISVLLMAFKYNGVKKTLKALQLFLITGLFVFILTPLTNHRGTHILFHLNDNPITLEAIKLGFFNMLGLLNVMVVFISFNKLIDSEKFLYLFSKMAPQITLITDMSLRYLSLYKKRTMEILEVQKIRKIEGNSFLGKIKNSGTLLELLVTWCLEEGMGTALILKAKDYGVKKRTSYRIYKFTILDAIYILIICVLMFLLVVLSKDGTYIAYLLLCILLCIPKANI